MKYKSLIFFCLVYITSFNLMATVVRYQHTDMLGSVISESDETGNIISRSHYEPFGKRIGGDKEGMGYTGHLHDKDLGLTYMQARYYDPLIGRFYSNDPLDFRDVHSFNRYTYANNNPYRFTDPDGRESLGVLIGNLLSGKSLEESAKSTHETNMAMANGAKEALSFTRVGAVIDTVETVIEAVNGESVVDNVSGMATGEIAGAVTEKVLEKKLGKEGSEFVGAVVGKLSGDAAKSYVSDIIENKPDVPQINPDKVRAN